MPQSLAQIYLHIVFSTKDRIPFLDNKEQRERMHAYLSGICRNKGCPSIQVGGTVDHVHIACFYGREIMVKDLIRELKVESSKECKSWGVEGFAWQRGYSAFSISPSHLNSLIRYIQTQEEHHRTVSFKEELLRLLKKYNVEFNEKYLWE